MKEIGICASQSCQMRRSGPEANEMVSVNICQDGDVISLLDPCLHPEHPGGEHMCPTQHRHRAFNVHHHHLVQQQRDVARSLSRNHHKVRDLRVHRHVVSKFCEVLGTQGLFHLCNGCLMIMTMMMGITGTGGRGRDPQSGVFGRNTKDLEDLFKVRVLTSSTIESL